MDCPNCDRRPVKRFYTFRLNGVSFKNYLKGYFRCRHCGTLLKQAKKSTFGLESIPSYEKGFWKWFILFMILVFGLLMGTFVLFGESETTLWTAIPIYLFILIGTMLGIDEIKANFWILEDIDDIEEDQKVQPRMGILGWTLLLGYFFLMLGGGMFVDQYVDLSGFAEWQYIVGMILYVIAIVAGGLAIFDLFSEKESTKHPQKASRNT